MAKVHDGFGSSSSEEVKCKMSCEEKLRLGKPTDAEHELAEALCREAARKGILRVAFACNHYCNGQFQGWCDAIHIDEAEFEGPRTTIRELSPSELRVGRCTYRIRGGQEWVGNWCWNEYVFERAEAVRLLRSLRKRGWQCVAR